jgi:hypothetical protein
MQCFNGVLATEALRARLSDMQGEVGNLAADKMDLTDRDSWVDYFVSRYEADPLTIHPEAEELDLEEKTVQIYNVWSRQVPYEEEYFDSPGFKATCRVPYSGDSDLFWLTPSTHALIDFQIEDLIEPGKDNLGTLTFAYEVTQQKATAEDIKADLDKQIDDFCKETERVNADARQFNQALRTEVERSVDRRIQQLDKFATIRQQLNVPLNRVKGAPMAMPIPLPKKRLRFSEPKPSKGGEPEYSIGDADYAHITGVIDSCCSMMEAAPGSFASMQEEQLRDLIRATLGTHYENVGGETFRNKGKTDILIPFKDHAAYIAECKVWHGGKAFLGAIDQLFSYTTWRDTKVSVVIFNRENKDFEAMLDTMQETLETKAVQVRRDEHARWTCEVQDDGSERIMHVTVQAFDLFVRPDVS